MDNNIYRNRRQILQAASLSGLALTGARGAGAEVEAGTPGDEFSCNSEPEGRPSRPDPEEFEKARKAIWESFYEGVLSWGGNSMEDISFEPGLKEEKDRTHSVILQRKWKLWNKCGEQTKHCAFMAGLLAEGIRRHEHPGDKTAFDRRQFESAVQMVQTYQRQSMGAKFIGIVC